MLDDAGYTKGSDGIRTTPGGGKRLSFRLFGRSDSPTLEGLGAVHRRAGSADDRHRGQDRRSCRRTTCTEIIGDGDYDMFEWGWVVEPDPDYQLSTFTVRLAVSSKDGGRSTRTCPTRFYCNPAYDALYEQQSTTTDLDARADIVKQMQKMLYDDAPYVVTYYYDEPRGLPVRPVHRLLAAAGPEGLAAVPVRHLQLPQHLDLRAEGGPEEGEVQQLDSG